MSVFEQIEAQQKGQEYTDVFMAGEQLKELCRREPACADLLEKDLAVKGMGLIDAAKKIKAWADGHRNGRSCVCVPPDVAEEILREFYGLPKAGEAYATAAPGRGQIVNLEDFL